MPALTRTDALQAGHSTELQLDAVHLAPDGPNILRPREWLPLALNLLSSKPGHGAVSDIVIQVGDAKFMMLVEPSGYGKTSVLRTRIVLTSSGAESRGS